MKVKFHGSKKVHYVFRMAALEHNCGYKASSLLDKIRGGEPAAVRVDLQEERLVSPAKRPRQIIKGAKVEDKESDYVPGKITYSMGARGE